MPAVSSLVPSRGICCTPDLRPLQKEPPAAPQAAGRSWNMCVLLRLAASDAGSSCKSCSQAPVTMLTSAPQFPVPQASAETFPSPSARGSALPANLGAGADRVGLLMPGWWAGWRPLQPRCRARTPCVWSPGSNPVRSRGDLQAGPVCAALTQVWTRGAPWEAGRRQELGSQQHEKLFTAGETESCDRGPCGVSRAGGPCPAPADGASWNLLTGSLPLSGEAEGGGSRRGSFSLMPGPRGGARRDLRCSLLAAVGRAWLTRWGKSS